jgi:hypothetical protein
MEGNRNRENLGFNFREHQGNSLDARLACEVLQPNDNNAAKEVVCG